MEQVSGLSVLFDPLHSILRHRHNLLGVRSSGNELSSPTIPALTHRTRAQSLLWNVISFISFIHTTSIHPIFAHDIRTIFFPFARFFFFSQVKKLPSLARRLYRIFGHAYFQHRDVFDKFESETSLCKRFHALVVAFDIMKASHFDIPTDLS
jgi:hypothetical protein